jgi:hypothetical protein
MDGWEGLVAADRSIFDESRYTSDESRHPEHVFAFMRGEESLIFIPRFTFTLTKGKSQIPTTECWEGQQVTRHPGTQAQLDGGSRFTFEQSMVSWLAASSMRPRLNEMGSPRLPLSVYQFVHGFRS